MNSCCSEALMNTKQCLQLGTFMNSFSRKAWALSLWTGSVFLRGFLTSHTPGWTLQLPLGALLCEPRQNVQPDLSHPGTVWERVAKARSIGRRLSSLATMLSLRLALNIVSALECFVLVFIPVHCTGQLINRVLETNELMIKRLKGPAPHYPESEHQRQDQTSLPDTLMTALSIESTGLCAQNQRESIFTSRTLKEALSLPGPRETAANHTSGCELGMNCQRQFSELSELFVLGHTQSLMKV